MHWQLVTVKWLYDYNIELNLTVFLTELFKQKWSIIHMQTLSSSFNSPMLSAINSTNADAPLLASLLIAPFVVHHWIFGILLL